MTVLAALLCLIPAAVDGQPWPIVAVLLLEVLP